MTTDNLTVSKAGPAITYGGYVVLDSSTIFPHKIYAGIDLMRPANLITYIENTEAYRKDLLRKEYGDEQIPSVRRSVSQTAPINININISTRIYSSLLIVSSKNDPRVPFTENLSIYQALTSAGHDAALIRLSQEGNFINGAADRTSIWSAQVILSFAASGARRQVQQPSFSLP